LAEEVGDYWAEEKPPEFESLIQIFQSDWFDAVIEVAEKLCCAPQGGKSFGRGAAELRIFEDADAEATEIPGGNFAQGDWR